MRLRTILNTIIYSTLVVFLLASCNSSDSEYTIGSESPDAQIISFKVAGEAGTDIDSISYNMASVNFAISSDGGVNNIFNPDSLPMHTKVGTLLVTLGYSSSPGKIDLVYKSTDGRDSIPSESWNTSDSIKFVQYDGIDGFYPRFIVTAPKGDEREYIVNFNIHKSDPDSIRWWAVTSMKLPKEGENKTIKNTDGTKFLTLIKAGSEIFFSSADISINASWDGGSQKTNLPSNTIIKSFMLVKGSYIVNTEEGVIWTAGIANPTTWTKHEENKILAILGLIPGYNTQSEEELVVIYKNADNKNVFAKIDIESPATLTELKISGFESNALPEGFPVKEFSSVTNTNYLMVIGGKSDTNNINKYTWVLKNLSSNEINYTIGSKDKIAKYDNGVTTFLYNKQIYMLASDSIYTSASLGDLWKKATEKQQFNDKIINKDKEIHTPSIVVDKDDYIWVFGGRSKNNKYRTEVWRGRLNSISFLYKD